MANGRLILLIALIVASVAIVIYLFGNRKRGQRIESYRNIPFEDEGRQRSGKSKNGRGED